MQISYKTVKTCYKIKIDSGDFQNLFRRFCRQQSLLNYQQAMPHPPNRAPFTVPNFLSCTPIVALSDRNSATIAPLNSHFNTPMIYVLHPLTA